MGDSAKQSLASLRIGACLAVLLEDSGGPARASVRVPAALRQFPEGLRFAASLLPDDPAVVDGLVWAFRAASLLALVGLWTEWSLLAAALLGAVVLPLAQLAGPTVHNHHLFWFLLLLAASGPASSARWSVDALLRVPTWSPAQEARAQVAVGFGRALLGLVYFFPGYWKMMSSGLSWLEPQALVQLFHSKWYQFDLLPHLRIDHFPLLLSAGAAGIVLLELSFPLLMVTRRGRALAFFLGLSFHVLSAQLLGIAFAPLWLCYGLLVDWAGYGAWLRSERRREQRPRPLAACIRTMKGAIVPSAIGSVCIAGFLVQGFRGQSQSWPWATYPTFQWIVPSEQADVLAVVVDSQPPSVYPTPRLAQRRSQREWGQVFRLLGAYGDGDRELREARCAYAQVLLQGGQLPRPAGEPVRIDLFEVARPTAPEHWHDEPRQKRHLARCVAPSARGDARIPARD